MRKLVLFIALATPALYSQEETPDHRLRTSTAVLHEIMSAPDKGIPNDLLNKAQCMVIVPELKKAAFIVGGEYGRGFAVCRNDGTWGAPAAVRVQRRKLRRADWRRVNGHRNARDEPSRNGKVSDRQA